jgi:hypothetical protein
MLSLQWYFIILEVAPSLEVMKPIPVILNQK